MRPVLVWSLAIAGVGVSDWQKVTAAAHPIRVERLGYYNQVVNYHGESITLTSTYLPTLNNAGHLGFGGAAQPGNGYIWFDEGVRWLNTDDPRHVLTGVQGLGISDSGGFIYVTNLDGIANALYTHRGPLLVPGSPVPGLQGQFVSSDLAPTMLPNGIAYWLALYTSITGVSGRALLRCADVSDPQSITLVQNGGDVIEGQTIGPEGIEFRYDVSDNDAHLINQITFRTNLDAVVLDGTIIAMQNTVPPPQGGNWTQFRDVGVNNNGTYVFAGASGFGNPLAMIVVNGELAIVETNPIAGIVLPQGDYHFASELSINNVGQIAHIWEIGLGGAQKCLFIGKASNLASTSRKILRTGDQIDYTDDGVADATVMYIDLFGGPTRILDDQGAVMLAVALSNVSDGRIDEAIIRVPPSVCPADIIGAGASANTVDIDDLLAVINGWGSCPAMPWVPCADIVNSGTSAHRVDVDDLLAVISAWGPCP